MLSSGPITSDVLSVELIESAEYPSAIRVNWPSVPTVVTPERFANVALSVIALLDVALQRPEVTQR